jgi:hypothetical protein
LPKNLCHVIRSTRSTYLYIYRSVIARHGYAADVITVAMLQARTHHRDGLEVEVESDRRALVEQHCPQGLGRARCTLCAVA